MLKTVTEVLRDKLAKSEFTARQNAEDVVELQKERDMIEAKVAEQQREIERLKAWIINQAQHTRDCEHNRWDQPLCTCGLDEVLNERT